MNESTSFPLYEAAIIYGVRPGSDLEPKAAFSAQAAAYRERFKRDGTALTRAEAAAAYRLVAPLCNPNPDPDRDEYRAVVFRFSRKAPRTGRIYLNMETISNILTAFEAEHAGNPSRGIKPPWERYFALRFLQLLVCEKLTLTKYPRRDLRELITRAVPILDRERPVTRPRGRDNPATNQGRDMFIAMYLEALEGYGLPVTSSGGDSLAGALSEAIGVSERTIRKVWAENPLRDPDLNDEMPADLRMPESLVRRPREYFAVGLRCAGCGRAGRVPKFRAGKGESRLCLSCRPASGECF